MNQALSDIIAGAALASFSNAELQDAKRDAVRFDRSRELRAIARELDERGALSWRDRRDILGVAR